MTCERVFCFFFFFLPPTPLSLLLARAPVSWEQSCSPLSSSSSSAGKGGERKKEREKKRWPLSVVAAVPSPPLMAAAAPVFSCSPLWEFPSGAACSAPAKRRAGVALAHFRRAAPASPPQNNTGTSLFHNSRFQGSQRKSEREEVLRSKIVYVLKV